MRESARSIGSDVVRAAVLVMAFAVFWHVAEALWSYAMLVLNTIQAAAARHANLWAAAAPPPHANWIAALLDLGAVAILLAVALVTCFAPRKKRSVREFVLLTVLSLGYIGFKVIYRNLH